jgi:hypothetical protein
LVAKAERKERDEFCYGRDPTESGAKSTGSGGSVDIAPDDLSRFEEKGGWGDREPAAAEPQEKLMPRRVAQQRNAKP